MTYAQDMARLTSAAATLTTTPPPAAWSLPAEQVQPVLAARDTVTSALRDLAAALLRAAPNTARAAADVDAVTKPVAGDGALRGLQQALAALEPAVGADRPNLTQALTAGGGGLTQVWLGAARAAATLEGQHTAAALAGPTDAWAVTRDLAELCAALPYLDTDLAGALPPGHPARAALLHADGHGQLRLAAEHLRAQTTDLTEPATLPSTGPLPKARPLTGVSDLPAATAHLSALVHVRGPDLTAAEARAASKALAAGIKVTTQVLAQLPGPAAADAAAHWGRAAPHLPQLLQGQLATLTPPAPGVRMLAEQIVDQLSALAKLADRLDNAAPGSTDLPRRLQPLADLLARWAVPAAGLAENLHSSLTQAGAAGHLLAPRQDLRRGADARLLWLPLPPTLTGADPTVLAAGGTATALAQATPALRALTQHRSRATTTQPSAASGSGTTALARLRSAIQTRSASQLPPLPRPAHPALSPATALPPHAPSGQLGGRSRR